MVSAQKTRESVHLLGPEVNEMHALCLLTMTTLFRASYPTARRLST